MVILLIVDPAAPCFRTFFSTWTKQLKRIKGKNIKILYTHIYNSAHQLKSRKGCIVSVLEGELLIEKTS